MAVQIHVDVALHVHFCQDLHSIGTRSVPNRHWNMTDFGPKVLGSVPNQHWSITELHKRMIKVTLNGESRRHHA